MGVNVVCNILLAVVIGCKTEIFWLISKLLGWVQFMPRSDLSQLNFDYDVVSELY